jgi:hypothetical protein
MGRRSSKTDNTMTTGTTTLAEVLGKASRFNPGHFLYLPMDEVWHLGTECAVLPQSDIDGVPDIAQQSGLSYALGVAAIQDIVANAAAQVKGVSLDQLFRAFLYYYDHDAFMTIEE